MAVLYRSGIPNTMMRLAQHIGFEEFELRDLDPDDEAYASLAHARAAHLFGTEDEDDGHRVAS